MVDSHTRAPHPCVINGQFRRSGCKRAPYPCVYGHHGRPSHKRAPYPFLYGHFHRSGCKRAPYPCYNIYEHNYIRAPYPCYNLQPCYSIPCLVHDDVTNMWQTPYI